MTTYLFWKHLDGLTAAHKALEKECDDLKSENERVKRILQSLQLHETITEQSTLPNPESCREDILDDAGVEPSAHAVTKTSPSKSLRFLKRDENQMLADSVPDSWSKILCSQDAGKDQVLAECTPVSCSMLCSRDHYVVSALSVAKSESGIIPSGHADISMSADEIVFAGSAPSAVSFGSVSFGSAPSIRSLMGDVADLSDVRDVSQRWREFVRIFILYKCRGDYRLLPCWNDHTALATLRRLIRHYVAELGTVDQLWEPIVQEWLGSKKKFSSRRRTSPSIEDDSVPKAMIAFSAYDSGGDYKSPPCMIHPLSTPRVIWSSLGLLSVAYDGVMLSLSIFEFQGSDAHVVAEWTLRVFWVLDIIACFRTGFYIKSKYESRPIAVAKNYIRTWLAFDLVALVPDIVVALMFSGESSGGLFKTVRYLKLFKTLRLLRVAKLVVLITEFLESLNSIYVALWLQIIKYCCLLICWVHLVGCSWYAIGKHGCDSRNSWIMKAGVEDVRLPQSYFIAIQWALCLLQGSTDVYPSFKSSMEGGFTVVAIALSIFILAVFISNITNVLIILQHAWDDRARKSRALQEYLSRHQISVEVAEAVRRYSADNTKVQLKLHLDEDDVAASLPKVLRRSLLVEVRGPMVNVKNPVFLAIQSTLPQCFDKICCDLLVTLFVEPDTVVYNYGEDCDQIYFNVTGEVFYDQMTNRALEEWLTMFQDVRESLFKNMDEEPKLSLFTSVKTDRSIRLNTSADDLDPIPKTSRGIHVPSNGAGNSRDSCLQKAFMRERLRVSSIKLKSQPICEPAFWTTWRHHGDLHTTTHTGFLTLNVDSFSLLVEHNPNLRSLCVCQAVRFCRVLNSGDCKRSDLMTTGDVLTILRSHGELINERRSWTRTSFRKRYSTA